MAPGRVKILYYIFLIQHVAEFKHIFEHFTANTQNERRKKEDSKLVDGDGQEGKDAFTKATESLTNADKKEDK